MAVSSISPQSGCSCDGAGLEEFLQKLRSDSGLWSDFLSLCEFGGRLAGTSSETAAQDWCAERLVAAAPAATFRRDPTPYAGWHCERATLTETATASPLDMTPLLGSAFTPAEGLYLDVLDLGRGTPDEIRAAGGAVKGRAVMVHHEYPFSTTTVHRRVKLSAAQECGAAAFIVVQPEIGVGPVSGSSGRAGGAGIPSMGISAESAGLLRHRGARVHVVIEGRDLPEATTDVLVLDIPGQGPDRVVLSAHIDGHPLAESAIDNGTGVAALVALARNLAPRVATMARGLTVCVFSAEEWALQGSRAWLSRLPPQEHGRMVLNVNLDSLAGSPRLTVLASGFEGIAPFVDRAVTAAGRSVGHHLPLMANSDHANFAALGVPAMRLIAGFNEPESQLRLLLTGADRRCLVDEAVLREATLTAGTILWNALAAKPEAIARLRGDALVST